MQRYLDNKPIDISSLADECGASRASAYRWLGDNDQLLAEVLRRRVREIFREAETMHVNRSGVDRVREVLAELLRHSDQSERFQKRLRENPARMLAIVASKSYPNQRDVISLVQGLLEEEVNKRNLPKSLDVHTLAYTLVRMMEAFLYADVVAGEDTDVESARFIIDYLLDGAVRAA